VGIREVLTVAKNGFGPLSPLFTLKNRCGATVLVATEQAPVGPVSAMAACYAAPMQVTLTPHGEEILKDQLARNAGSSPEQIVERALEKLAEEPPTEGKKTAAEAVAHIRESRKTVTLGGLKIKDLIHEGHKY